MAASISSLTGRYTPIVPANIHVERCWPQITKLSPCEAACPLHMDIPSYIIAISQGDAKTALSVIREMNPLPSVCGRACHRPCENECNRGVVDRPVAIQWLKRYAAEWGDSEKPSPMPRTREEMVAIVGSGPAGLTASHDLVKKGYGVTIFEASSIAGGILSSVMPSFVLSPEAVQADISYIKNLGVQIHTNVRIGKDVGLAGLWRQGYKAILIAIGLQKSAELEIPGADLAGVSLAMPVLREAKSGRLQSMQGKVWVIGGGGVAVDVARTALRLGAREVHLACLESSQDMPAFKWEIESATKEGVKIHPSLAPQEFVSRDGKVGGINFKRVKSTSVDSEGRVRWNLMGGSGSDYAVDADAVVVAIGQIPDMSGLLGEALESLNITTGGGFAVNKQTLETNVPGIFAAGDISATGGTITDAMAAGRRAAASIDQYLRGTPVEEVKESQEIIRIKPEQVADYFTRRERWEMPRLLPKEAVRTFHEVELGYQEWQAVEEAKRCLNCRTCANCIFERGQLCFETADRLL